jgi:hypothetical protein
MDGAQSGYLSHLLIRLSAEVRHRLPEIAGSRRPPQCGRARDVTHTSTGRAQTSTALTFPSAGRPRRRTSIRARDVAFPPFWRIGLCRRSAGCGAVPWHAEHHPRATRPRRRKGAPAATTAAPRRQSSREAQRCRLRAPCDHSLGHCWPPLRRFGPTGLLSRPG